MYYIPGLNTVTFSMQPMNGIQWGITFAFMIFVFLVMEAEKAVRRMLMLRDVKKNDSNGGGEGTTRLNSTAGSGSRAVIGGRDGNPRNYAVKVTKRSGQD